MKRLVLVVLTCVISALSLFAQEKRIAVLVTTKDVPANVNTQPVVDDFMKALSRSGYKVVDRTDAVLQSREVELDFQALNADKKTMAKIGKDHGAKYVCNIDISFLPYDKPQQYYFSVHMIDVENTDVDCVTGYPENRRDHPVTVLSRVETRRASLFLIRDIDDALGFLNTQQRNKLNADIDEYAVIDQKIWDDQIGEYKSKKAYAFVPGLAQLKDGATGLGITFIAGETVCIGGIVVSQYLSSLYASQSNSTHSATDKQRLAQMSNVCNVTTYVSAAGAIGLYVWNIVDGLSRAKKPHKDWVFVPYTTHESYGITLALNF